jgi:Protein of unknown function (DUF3093)
MAPDSHRSILPAGASPAGRHTPSFSERVIPSVGGWIGIVVFAAVLGVALSVVNATTAFIVGSVTLVIGCVVAWATAPVVQVRAGELRAGPAHIPLAELGEVTVLNRAQVSEQMGPQWDARAYACLRTWAGSALRIEVVDPNDATPFWVISTRRPHDLAAAIAAWA